MLSCFHFHFYIVEMWKIILYIISRFINHPTIGKLNILIKNSKLTSNLKFFFILNKILYIRVGGGYARLYLVWYKAQLRK